MIRHCIFINFEEATTNRDRLEALGVITALQTHPHNMLSVHMTPNSTPKFGMKKGYA